MARTRTLLALLSLSACADPGGVFDLQVGGVPELASLADLHIDWAGDVAYTREVRCEVEREEAQWDYLVAAWDASVGEELGVEVRIQTYSGPKAYDRDENQPLPVLALRFAAPDGGGEWRVDSSGGGTCSVEVAGQSDRGSFECVDVDVTLDGVSTGALATAAGSWDCGAVTLAGFEAGGRGAREDDLEGDDDDLLPIGR